MTRTEINPYVERVFGVWFKNVVILLFAVPTLTIITLSVIHGWIGKDFSLQLFFLFSGVYLARWFDHETA